MIIPDFLHIKFKKFILLTALCRSYKVEKDPKGYMIHNELNVPDHVASSLDIIPYSIDN